MGDRRSGWVSQFYVALLGNKKGDIFLAARRLGGTLKTSFHRDGCCHSGLTNVYVYRIRGEGKAAVRKYFDRWELASELLVQAFQILVPTGELRLFRPSDADQMKWIPSLPPGQVVGA
jgi:hypothetical protein